jgi:iron(III) transport system substrate-binding protein
VICFNTAEAAKDKIAMPTSWKDMTKPEYKGKLVMPHPASSGTGYLMVGAWIQMMGEAEAWKFMDALHENIAVYTHSGSAPCVQAAKGERVAGIALDMRGASEKTKGAPLEVIIPAEGTGWEMEAYGIVKGTKNLEAAKKIADWAATKGANELYSKTYAVVAMPGIVNYPPNYPADAEKKMIKNNFVWMAENREKILGEWTKRYESKAAPK